MSINIKTAEGLKKLSGENITKEKIITALGYTPSDEVSLDDHINEGDIHVTLNDKAKWNAKSDFSGNYNDLPDKPSLTDDGSDTLHIVDKDGNVIAKIDKDGAQTTELTLGAGENAVQVGEKLADLEEKIDNLDGGGDFEGLEKKVDDHIAEDDTHITNEERAEWNNKSDFSGEYNDLSNKPIEEDNTGKFVIADENGFIIATIDEQGMHTTEVWLPQGKVSEMGGGSSGVGGGIRQYNCVGTICGSGEDVFHCIDDYQERTDFVGEIELWITNGDTSDVSYIRLHNSVGDIISAIKQMDDESRIYIKISFLDDYIIVHGQSADGMNYTHGDTPIAKVKRNRGYYITVMNTGSLNVSIFSRVVEYL